MHSIPPPIARPDPGSARSSYGIQDAIRLVRRLPFEQNRDLVTTVLKTTLESLGVGLRDLINDADRHQGALRARAREATREIATLEEHIRTCRHEIDGLWAEHAEVESAKERLARIEAIHRGMTTTVYTRFDL